MAITAIGYDGTVTEFQFAQLMRTFAVTGGWPEVVQSGFDVSPGAGLAVSVSSGVVLATSVRAVSDSAVSVPLTANSGVPRTDAVVAEFSWSANTVVVKALVGSGATKPVITQTEGTLWQTVLAWVTVPTNAVSVAAANIATAKPLPRLTRVFTGTVTPGVSAGANGSPVASVTVSDPGWPYKLDVSAATRVSGDSTVADRMAGLEVVTGSGVTIAAGVSPFLSGDVSVAADGVSSTFTGPTTVSLRLYSAKANGSVSNQLSVANSFTVRQLPA